MSEFFKDILSFDSTSGKEMELAEWLYGHVDAPERRAFEVGDGTLNLLFSWGTPRLVFCTHMDTVPPYLPPLFDGDVVRGRGTCDAKGQIYAMYKACRSLADEGRDGFALLLLSGEETGSFGAKAFSACDFRAPYLLIGEPTENKMVSASKGTASFGLDFRGEAFHSGYPEHGSSAVEAFVDFCELLRSENFVVDDLLGPTTYNIGMLSSDNPQNVLSPSLFCRLYFRTTFASAGQVRDFMSSVASRIAARKGVGLTVESRGGDAPARYMTVPGIPSAPVSFGSDAPHLGNFGHKMICGPGSILTAHRPDEQVRLSEIDAAVEIYRRIFAYCSEQ